MGLSGRGPTVMPGYKGSGRNGLSGNREQTSGAAYIEIDDDDVDELAHDNVPCSSPYFTQPTQIVGRTTQPTQIIDRNAPKLPSSPLVPSTPNTIIEVPASSPFQSKSQAKPSIVPDRMSGAASRIGSLMAPAGTTFRPPGVQKTLYGANNSTKKRDYLEISDDDLIEDYKKNDSSDDGTPVRGDIRPSSFMKKSTPTKNKNVWYPNEDISFNDIRDIRLRTLTSQVYKIVQRAKPGITVRACKEALQKDVGWQVTKAVDLLTGRTTKTLSSPTKVNDAPTTSPYNNSTRQNSSSVESPPASPKLGRSAPKNTLQSFLKKDPSTTNSSRSSQSFTERLQTQKSTGSSARSINSFDTDKSSNPPRRRRLVQGRRRSPTPPPVFSISSSSTSSPTTPTQSRDSSPAKESKMSTTTKNPAASKALANGQRTIGMPMSTTIDKFPDRDLPLILGGSGQPQKRKTDSKDLPQAKRAKPAANKSSTPPRKRKSPTPKKMKDELGYDTSDYEDNSAAAPSKQIENVLNYLNTCTVETLGQMIGSTNDAKLMVASRPFKTIEDAEGVTRLGNKSKSKSKAKSKKFQYFPVGENVVEKLTGWLEACDAAKAVIDECEKRGREIKTAMSTWPLDSNGETKTDTEGLGELPIGEMPEYMDESVRLKPYQLVGLNWMSLLHSKGYSGILGDDMGLGKTCQVISFIAHLAELEPEEGARNPWPNLVVVPPSTYENWISEFQKFAPEISVFPYSGSHRLDSNIEDAWNSHVILTTYTQVERRPEDIRWLQEADPYTAIFDEGHRFKNQGTISYKQLGQVPAEWRLILTGTPVQNNLKELLSLLRFLEPSLFEGKSFETLNTIFETKVQNKDVLNFAALASERVNRARAIIAPFILQRRKGIVVADLPGKVERLEVVGMHDIQKKIYDSIKGDFVLNNGVKRKDSSPWVRLRKAAIHHQLFRYHFTDSKVKEMVDILWKSCSESELKVDKKDDRHKAYFQEMLMDGYDFDLHLWCKDFKKYIGHLDIPHRSWEDSPKVQKLLELVRGYMKTGDRALVFSRFQMVIRILEETLHYANISYCVLTGSTETAGRFPECQEFTADPSIPVFLLTTGAGGTGLNIPAANKIILFDQSDNPQDDVQASNRAHRIGQTREVEVIRIVTEKTVEGLIYNSCVKKLVLAARVEGQYDEDDEEPVEVQCKRLMLLEPDIDTATEIAPSTQQI
ncbi:SNF2 family N-terminal domain-containing protein [Hypoxylon trugodes]|uniref:SNF2 family N-terminal domain-containing protein n=1 Tax=Hypoxylon trugodes TaxID=326681 RepID=UPI00218D4417|nr:SNF2 family N-terminal domain-containing protein [Hypoxylon trugodes]KAI1394225.1 SNF2 family N-terminal domain-containing protein [Hypoxylon trugodes]